MTTRVLNEQLNNQIEESLTALRTGHHLHLAPQGLTKKRSKDLLDAEINNTRAEMDNLQKKLDHLATVRRFIGYHDTLKSARMKTSQLTGGSDKDKPIVFTVTGGYAKVTGVTTHDGKGIQFKKTDSGMTTLNLKSVPAGNLTITAEVYSAGSPDVLVGSITCKVKVVDPKGKKSASELPKDLGLGSQAVETMIAGLNTALTAKDKAGADDAMHAISQLNGESYAPLKQAAKLAYEKAFLVTGPPPRPTAQKPAPQRAAKATTG